jgi:hypothetical protein
VNPQHPAVARRADRRCEYCRAPEPAFNFPFEVEHVLPLCRGGRSEPENLALACRACNARKGDAVAALDPSTGAEVPLFNPRTDRWHDHFRVDPDSGEVVGITPTGRATVGRLDMNAAFQLTARLLWTRFKLFP